MRMFYDAIHKEIVCEDCGDQIARERGAHIDDDTAEAERKHQLAECDPQLLRDFPPEDRECTHCGADWWHPTIDDRIEAISADLAHICQQLHSVAVDCPNGAKTRWITAQWLQLVRAYRQLDPEVETDEAPMQKATG